MAPVVVPGDRELKVLEVGVSCEWPRPSEGDRSPIQRTMEAAAKALWGPEATVMSALAVRGDQIVRCPICGEQGARFQFAGF